MVLTAMLSRASTAFAVAAASRVATATLWAYCLPMVGIQFLWMMFGIYFMKYSTDVLLVAPAVIGGLFLLARVWDAISDLLAGYLSDRSKAKTSFSGFGRPGDRLAPKKPLRSQRFNNYSQTM